MASITVDALQVLITANSKDLDEKLAKISQNVGGLSGDTSKATSSMSAALQKVGDIGVKALKVGVVGAIAAVAASIPGAVKRIDTLVAFPRVLEAMGASSVQAAKATDTLAKRLSGLPTPLQEGAAGVQALVSAGLGVEEATDVFLAFNNATLAASTEAGAAQGAFTQLVQSISKGKIEGQEWNSIVAAMPTAFQALSKESGLTREELRELYRTDPQKLLDDLTKLDKEGGGGLASLDEQARAATGGIGTSFANMRNAIVRGLEGIVKKLGDGSLEAGQKKISDMITKVGVAFENVLKVVGNVVAFIMQHKDISGALAVGIGVLVGAITAATIAMGIFNAVMAINSIALIIMAVAALVAGLIYLWNTSDGFRNFFIGMWGAIVTAVQPVVDIFNAYLLPALQMVWGFIVNQFQKAWEDLKKAYEQIKQTLQPYIDQMKGPLMEVLKAVGIAIAVAVIAPLVLLGAAIVAVVTVIGVIVSAIARFIGWIANLYAELMKVGNLVAGHVANSFSNAWSKIVGVWSAAVGFFSGVASGIVNHLSSLPGKMKELFDKAVTAIKSIDWGGIGMDIIKGIGNGIAGMGGWLAQKAKDAVGGAKDQLKSFLGIHSPSRVMRDEVGKMMGMGVAEGIDASTRNVMSSMKDLANVSVGNFDSSVNVQHGFSDFTNSGNSQPLIINVGGERLVDTVIQGINGRSFLGGSSVINV